MWQYYQPATYDKETAKARPRRRVAVGLPGIGTSRLIIPGGGNVSFPLSGLRDFLKQVSQNGGSESTATTTPTTTTTKPEPIAAEQPVKTFSSPVIESGGQLYTVQSVQPSNFAAANRYIPPQRVEGEVAPDPLSAEYAALAASAGGGYGVTPSATGEAASEEGLTPTTWVLLGVGLFAALTVMRKRRR